MLHDTDIFENIAMILMQISSSVSYSCCMIQIFKLSISVSYSMSIIALIPMISVSYSMCTIHAAYLYHMLHYNMYHICIILCCMIQILLDSCSCYHSINPNDICIIQHVYHICYICIICCMIQILLDSCYNTHAL